MNASLRAPMTLAFILAIPLFARPALGASGHDAAHKAAHHRVADFAAATGLPALLLPFGGRQRPTV